MADDDDADLDDSHRATESRRVIGTLELAILPINVCSRRCLWSAADKDGGTYPSTDVVAKMRPAAVAASAAAPAYDVLRSRSPAANLMPNTAGLSRGDERAMVRIMAVVVEPSEGRKARSEVKGEGRSKTE